MKKFLRYFLLSLFTWLFVSSASAHYDPRLGRWISRDPLGEEGGFNQYAYCGNDPVNKHDALGLAQFEGSVWTDDKNQVWLVGWKLDSNGFLGTGTGRQSGKRKIGTLIGGEFVQFLDPIRDAGGNFVTGLPLNMLTVFATAQGRWINKQASLRSMGAGGAADTLQRNLVAMMLAAKSGSDISSYFYESPTTRIYARHYTSNGLGLVGGVASAAFGITAAPGSAGTSLAATWYGADVAGTSLQNLASGPDGALPTFTNQMLSEVLPQHWANRAEMVFGAGLGARMAALQLQGTAYVGRHAGPSSGVPMGYESVEEYQRAWAELAVPERCAAIRAQLGRSAGFGETYAVGAVYDGTNVQIVVSSRSAYGLGKVNRNLLPGESYVGRGVSASDAEIQILDWANLRGLSLWGIGATRPVCVPCQIKLDGAVIPIWTLRK